MDNVEESTCEEITCEEITCEEIRVTLEDGVELVIRLQSRALKTVPEGDQACAAESSMVVFGHVPRPPPKRRVATLNLSVPVSGASQDCESTDAPASSLLEMVLDVELDAPSSAA